MKDRDGEQAIVVEENKTSSVAVSFNVVTVQYGFRRSSGTGRYVLRLQCRAREKVSFPAILP